MSVTATFLAHPGLGNHLRRELSERFKLHVERGEVPNSAILKGSKKQVLKTLYLAQTPKAALIRTSHGPFSSLPNLEPSWKQPIKRIENGTYRVSANRVGTHEHSSVDIEKHFGTSLYQEGFQDVDLSAPDFIVHVEVVDDAYEAGILIHDGDLTKRQYKVFSSSDGINASVAFAALQDAGIENDMTVVDPFCRDGVFPIELALWKKGVSVNHYSREFKLEELGYYDLFETDDVLDGVDEELPTTENRICAFDKSFRNLKATKKNAKIAGVQKHLEYSRFEAKFIDLKFDDFEVDRIVGRPEEISRHKDQEIVKEMYYDLFRYGKYVLSPRGKMVFLVKDTNNLLHYADQFNLSVESRKPLSYKHVDYEVVTLWRDEPLIAP